MKLSQNLTLAEVTRSEIAKRRGISNQPNAMHLANLQILAKKIFEPIRHHFGKPIYISSGYRSEALNKAIKGSKSSQHCLGQAFDIDNDGTDILNSEIFNYIKDNLEFDQLIWEFGNAANPDWVHVSYNPSGNRKQILVAYKFMGMTRYRPYKA